MAQPVAEALGDYTRSWMEKGMDWGGWMAAVNEAKSEFARLINADARDIAAMSCVSDITSSIGSALEFAPAKNGIVVGDVDFPSMGHVWLAHERKGAVVQFVPAGADHTIATEAYRSAINDATALVSLDAARRCGLRSMSPPDLARKSAITAIHVANASVMEHKLAQEGFIVSARNDVIRIAPHFYNTEDEVAGAVRAIAQAQAA